MTIRILSTYHKRILAIDRGLIILMGWPLLLLAMNNSWVFTRPGAWIDPFVYTGFFHNLTQHLQVFSGTYYGTRLPWILPGYLLNRLLPPLIANYVLHIGVYYVGILSLNFILKNTLNQRTALVTSLLMGS